MYLMFLMILAMVLWGIGWPALKIVTQSVTVEVVTFWRFFIMFFAFIPVLLWWKKPLHVSKKAALIIIASALLNIMFMYFSFWGVQVGSAGMGGVLITTISPLLTVLLAVRFLHVQVRRSQWFGLVIGLIGGMVMLEVWTLEVLQGGNAFFLMSALVWAGLTLLSQKSHLHLEPLHYSFLLSCAAIPIMYGATFQSDLMVVFHQDMRFWSALLFLAVLGQTVASTIYFIASGKLGSGVASSYMFLVPLTALIASYFMLEEVPSFYLLIGGLISSVGLVFINKAKA
jgi:drug/metabolite transporter (DMT)-like permease